MIVNGVALPDIPADVLAEFPYVIIANAENADLPEIAYIAVVSSKEFVHCSGNLVGFDPEKVITTFGSGDMLAIADGGTEWESMGFPFSEGQFYWDEADVGLDEIGTAQDIYTIDSYDSSTGEYTKSDIWMAANISSGGESPAPKPSRYSIATAILDAVARQIMRLTDSTEKVKPEEFEPKLEGINIQLQELTVTATEEVQTITPPSGVYGFSKVIVEAVEDSGTGGGTPGEGGEGGEGTEDNYVSSDYVQFGAEITECPTPPDDGLPYYIIFSYADGGTYLLTSLSAFECYNHTHNAHTDIHVGSSYNGNRYTLSGGWGTPQTNYWPVCVSCDSGDSGYLGTVLFTNHDIMKGGEVWMEAMETESDSVAITIETPVERDETYTIEGGKLNDLVLSAQKITGTNEPMTPDEAIEALQTYQTQPKAEELTY